MTNENTYKEIITILIFQLSYVYILLVLISCEHQQ